MNTLNYLHQSYFLIVARNFGPGNLGEWEPKVHVGLFFLGRKMKNYGKFSFIIRKVNIS